MNSPFAPNSTAYNIVLSRGRGIYVDEVVVLEVEQRPAPQPVPIEFEGRDDPSDEPLNAVVLRSNGVVRSTDCSLLFTTKMMAEIEAEHLREMKERRAQ